MYLVWYSKISYFFSPFSIFSISSYQYDRELWISANGSAFYFSWFVLSVSAVMNRSQMHNEHKPQHAYGSLRISAIRTICLFHIEIIISTSIRHELTSAQPIASNAKNENVTKYRTEKKFNIIRFCVRGNSYQPIHVLHICIARLILKQNNSNMSLRTAHQPNAYAKQ